MPPDSTLPELVVRDARAFKRWLDRNHATSSGVWLVLSRKGTVTPTRLTHAQALEEALAHGWIDGKANRRDDATWKIRFTPRRKQSAWSKRNTLIAERLIEDGRMHPAGRAQIERARADGRWQAAYDGAATIRMPPDLAAALRAKPAAGAAFARLSGQNRYAILYRIQTARRDETRARRIENFVVMLARGETIYPQQR